MNKTSYIAANLTNVSYAAVKTCHASDTSCTGVPATVHYRRKPAMKRAEFAFRALRKLNSL